MFGRTTRLVSLLLPPNVKRLLLLLRAPALLAILWVMLRTASTRLQHSTPCCGPAPTCCGNPGMPMGAMPMGAMPTTSAMPIYHSAPVMVPTVPVSPANNPTSDRTPIASAAMSNIR